MPFDLTPTIQDFLATIEQRLGEQRDYGTLFGNRQRTSTRSGILKGQAVHLFAKALRDCGINSFDDLRDEQKLEAAEHLVKRIPGQGSGITFTYFLMLAGNESYVKPDTHVRRFVGNALTSSSLAPEALAAQLVKEAAIRLRLTYPSLTEAGLDYAIWDFQRLVPGTPLVKKACV